MGVSFDKHHVLHYAKEWRLRPEAKAIREHPSLVPTLPREVHNEIHKTCPPVPMLGYHALKRTVGLWTPRHDTMESLDNLMFAIEQSISDVRAHPIERQLGRLTVQAIDLQRPLIRENRRIA